MSDPLPPRRPSRRARVVALVGCLVAVGVVGTIAWGATSGSGSAIGDVEHATTVLRRTWREHTDGPTTTDDGRLGPEDGVVPDGVTVFDEQLPGIARLDPALLAALQAAATDAAADGVTFSVHSAWRSPAYQEQLRRDAVAEHGSEDAADRWAATPERSLHVSGDAADIGGTDARDWLAAHGARYGLCRVYENEPWHVELRPAAVAEGCPALYADASQDPRLRTG